MSYPGPPNYPPPPIPGQMSPTYLTTTSPTPPSNWYNTMQQFRPSQVQANAYRIMESKSSSGGVKATLIIIFVLVLIGCCILSWYNHFSQDGLTIGMLIFLNVITVFGMGLALMYGMGKGKREQSGGSDGADDFFSTSYDLELSDL